MSNLKFTNNAATTLAYSLSNSATSLTVAGGSGAVFPTLTGSQFFYCTLQSQTGIPFEIVKVTARSTDTFTITRAQDGTTASAFNLGDKVELRIVAAELNAIPWTDQDNIFNGLIDNSPYTGGLNIPQGTTAQRPSSLSAGNGLRYNTTTGFPEIYTSTGWKKIVPASFSYSIDYLVAAGGGGGGGGTNAQAGGGGGGAGGLLINTAASVTGGSVITVTVGSGGAGGAGAALTNGTNGNTSSISGTAITTVTTTGGGGGGCNSSAGYANGNSGGSGGGGYGNTGGSGTGGSGTSGQGNAGAATPGGGDGGGGGGASSSGSGSSAGSGSSSSITGSAITYAIGGSGTGGGSAGASNTGNGGNGGTSPGSGNGGNGGSGVVILSMLTSNYSGITTGSPTISTNGSNTVLKFTTSGSYTT